MYTRLKPHICNPNMVWKIMFGLQFGCIEIPKQRNPSEEGEVAPDYPTEACLFGLEVAEKDIDLPSLLVFLGKNYGGPGFSFCLDAKMV